MPNTGSDFSQLKDGPRGLSGTIPDAPGIYVDLSGPLQAAAKATPAQAEHILDVLTGKLADVPGRIDLIDAGDVAGSALLGGLFSAASGNLGFARDRASADYSAAEKAVVVARGSVTTGSYVQDLQDAVSKTLVLLNELGAVDVTLDLAEKQLARDLTKPFAGAFDWLTWLLIGLGVVLAVGTIAWFATR